MKKRGKKIKSDKSWPPPPFKAGLFSINMIPSKCKKRQHTIISPFLLTIIFFPVTICFYFSDFSGASKIMSMMQMWFCGWCLLDTGIVYLVINNFRDTPRYWVSASLASKIDTDLEPLDWGSPTQNIQILKSSVTMHEFWK